MFTINQNLIDDFADKINEKEKKSNKVTSLSSSSTNVEYPSAKAVYDAINNSVSENCGTFAELQTIINNAQSGDIIILDKDYKNENDKTNHNVSDITINKSLKIIGNGHIIDGENYNANIFGITDIPQQPGISVTFEDLYFINTESDGVIVQYSGGLIINHCYFINNQSVSTGGAVYTSYGTETNINDSIFINNKATPDDWKTYGGAIYKGGNGTGTIRNCTFINNNSLGDENYDGEGGAIWLDENNNVNIIDCTFIDNDATNGGAIYSIDSNFKVYNCTFENSTLYNTTNVDYLTEHQDISGKLDKAQTSYKGKNVVVDSTSGNITFEDKPTIPSASSTTPSADTTNGAVGSGTTWAKADHQHPKSSIYAEASHNHTKSEISDFPTLANVATSGSYADLSNKPTLSSLGGTVTVEEQQTAESGFTKTYIIKQGGVQVGNKINIPKDFLVKSASVKTVSTANNPIQGYVTGDKYLDFVVNSKDNTATDEHLYVLVSELVDTEIDWANVQNKPTFFDGNYNSLTNKPSIPSVSSDLSDGSDLVKKSSTTGLLKNDGSVMSSGTGSSNWAVGNHTHTTSDITNMPTVPSASSTTPSADTENGSVGTGTTWARSNHTHPKSSLYAESSHTHSDADITTVGFYSNLPQANYGSPSQQQVNFAINSAMGGKEDTSNKVSSWSSPTTDTHYPSEKLVKDYVDAPKEYFEKKSFTKTLDLAKPLDELSNRTGNNRYGNLYDSLNGEWEITVDIGTLSDGQGFGIANSSYDNGLCFGINPLSDNSNHFQVLNLEDEHELYNGFNLSDGTHGDGNETSLAVPNSNFTIKISYHTDEPLYYQSGEKTIHIDCYVNDSLTDSIIGYGDLDFCHFETYGDPSLSVQMKTEIGYPKLYETPLPSEKLNDSYGIGALYSDSKIYDLMECDLTFNKNGDGLQLYSYEPLFIEYNNGYLYLKKYNDQQGSFNTIFTIKQGNTCKVITYRLSDKLVYILFEGYWITSDFYSAFYDSPPFMYSLINSGSSPNNYVNIGSSIDVKFYRQIMPTRTSELINDSNFLTTHQSISGKEDKSNKVISLSSLSTDTQYPSAKCVYDELETKINIIEAINYGRKNDEEW